MKNLRNLGFVIVAACTMTLFSCVDADAVKALEEATENLETAADDAVDAGVDAAEEHSCEDGKCDGGH